MNHFRVPVRFVFAAALSAYLYGVGVFSGVRFGWIAIVIGGAGIAFVTQFTYEAGRRSAFREASDAVRRREHFFGAER